MQGKLLKLLEFDKIKVRLAECASTSLGKKLAEDCLPASELTEVRQRLLATDEAFKLDRIKGGVSFAGVSDTRSELKRAEIGGMLAATELIAIAGNLDGANRLKRQLADFHEQHPVSLLLAIADGLGDHKQLSTMIRSCIDEQGYVLDQASPELTRIRQEIRGAEGRAREKLEQMIRTSSVQKMLQEVLVTIRNERYVLPVKAEYRTSVRGIIHDQSASGATLYIEPEAVVQLNNRMKELKLREEREIEKILAQLSDAVAGSAYELIAELEVLAVLDFTFAKSKLARLQKASFPFMNDSGFLQVRKARHPLLDQERVVPLDLQLGSDYKGIVVTGPNTGGKTVALKTVGLLTLMAMSGLFVPAEDGTQMSVFDGIFADIGDEQSIEQNLSTFSAHMTNLIQMMDAVSSRSLVLMDEMGAGTDPTEGAALAVAILQYLQAKGCTFIATTHYSSLKAFAAEQPEMINASVEFDQQTLRPTYRLLVGVPGRSNALAIAERLGLRSEILQAARIQLSEDEQRVDRMLSDLEQQRLAFERERRQLLAEQQQLEELKSRLLLEKQTLEERRAKALGQSRAEAADIIKQTRMEAEQIIQELRQMQAMLQSGAGAQWKEHRGIEARKKLDDLQTQMTGMTVQASESVDEQEATGELQVGDEVQWKMIGKTGVVVEIINSRELIVQIGSMKSRVKRNQLKRLKAVGPTTVPNGPAANGHYVTVHRNREQSVGLELDVRGQTLDDALLAVDQYLSEVVLAGFSQVTLIHGVGTGVLRKGIQEHLKRHRHVKSHRPGRYGEGDLGVTVVEMK